jgi:hypothetical protein
VQCSTHRVKALRCSIGVSMDIGLSKLCKSSGGQFRLCYLAIREVGYPVRVRSVETKLSFDHEEELSLPGRTGSGSWCGNFLRGKDIKGLLI